MGCQCGRGRTAVANRAAGFQAQTRHSTAVFSGARFSTSLRILSLRIQQGPSQPLPWSNSQEPFLEMAVNMEPWGGAAKCAISRVQHLGSRIDSGLAGVSLGKLFNHFAPMFLTYKTEYHPVPLSFFSLSTIK